MCPGITNRPEIVGRLGSTSSLGPTSSKLIGWIENSGITARISAGSSRAFASSRLIASAFTRRSSSSAAGISSVDVRKSGATTGRRTGKVPPFNTNATSNSTTR